jgi:bacterioferritin
MKHEAIVKVLNRALSAEYAGIIQYLQNAQLVQGLNRELYEELFKKLSQECLTHAGKVGRWIVLLGSVPTVEPGPIKQTTDLNEMLRCGIELERTAYNTYVEALKTAEDNPPLRFFLEEMAYDEFMQIDEFERLLGTKTFSVPVKELKQKQA